jgi:hypothetical protein
MMNIAGMVRASATLFVDILDDKLHGGHTVVAADVGGQPSLFKKPLQHGEIVDFSGGGQRFTSEQTTAGVIDDRQRVAIFVTLLAMFQYVLDSRRTPAISHRTVAPASHAARSVLSGLALLFSCIWRSSGRLSENLASQQPQFDFVRTVHGKSS